MYLPVYKVHSMHPTYWSGAERHGQAFEWEAGCRLDSMRSLLKER